MIFISPHLDDVALSCAGRLIENHGSGGPPVTVLTLFTEGRPAATYARRRREDQGALAQVGAQVVHLGFDDAPTRLGVEPSWSSLCMDPSPAPVPGLEQALRQATEGLHPQEIWLPLGVGEHVDHLIAHAVGRRVFGSYQATLRFYLERPYATSGLLLNRRLARLRTPSPQISTSPAELPSSLAPFMRRHERSALETPVDHTGITEPLPSLRIHSRTWPGQLRPAAAALLAPYSSQVALLGKQPDRLLDEPLPGVPSWSTAGSGWTEAWAEAEAP